MTKIIHLLSLIIMIASMFSCKSDARMVYGDIPYMPMKAIYENSLDYVLDNKEVLESKLLSDMETLEDWKHKGDSGRIILSDKRAYKGQYSILLETGTKGPSNLPRPNAGVIFRVNNEDWSDWNRLTFWIYPDLPGFKIAYINMIFYNAGEDRVPQEYGWDWHYQLLENQQWNKVTWELSQYPRDKVTGVEIRYRLQGNELGATKTARYYIDELYLEKVKPEHFEGWDVQKGEIAFNHAGYIKGFPKAAFTSEPAGQQFYLKDQATGKTVKEGTVASQDTPLGTYQMMDFSDVNEEGTYTLEVGNLKTKPFAIGMFSDVFRIIESDQAKGYLQFRCDMVIESGIQPFIKFVNLIKAHWFGIVNYFESKLTNGILEGINSKIQLEKKGQEGLEM